eukprot:12646993-Alexandrium_andersonii.AAC.1
MLSHNRYLGAYWSEENSTASSAPPWDLMMVGSCTSDFRCQPLSKMASSRRRGIGRTCPPVGS